MSDYIAAKEVQSGDTLVDWPRYQVYRFESSAKHGGRIRLRDRYGKTDTWFPVDPDETVEIETRANQDTP